jgi:hypothetical protein
MSVSEVSYVHLLLSGSYRDDILSWPTHTHSENIMILYRSCGRQANGL